MEISSLTGIEDSHGMADGKIVAGIEDLARAIRLDSLRMIHAAGSGHPGGFSRPPRLSLVFMGGFYATTRSGWTGRSVTASFYRRAIAARPYMRP